jgi:hypothetical protein
MTQSFEIFAAEHRAAGFDDWVARRNRKKAH